MLFLRAFTPSHRTTKALHVELELVQTGKRELEARLEQLAAAEVATKKQTAEHVARMQEVERYAIILCFARMW